MENYAKLPDGTTGPSNTVNELSENLSYDINKISLEKMATLLSEEDNTKNIIFSGKNPDTLSNEDKIKYAKDFISTYFLEYGSTNIDFNKELFNKDISEHKYKQEKLKNSNLYRYVDTNGDSYKFKLPEGINSFNLFDDSNVEVVSSADNKLYLNLGGLLYSVEEGKYYIHNGLNKMRGPYSKCLKRSSLDIIDGGNDIIAVVGENGDITEVFQLAPATSSKK